MMRFQSLPSQVAVYLETEIANGRWVEYLPGERELAEALNVSRRTIASAIKQLQRTHIIQTKERSGHRILKTPVDAHRQRNRQVGMISSEPLFLMRPVLMLWAYELQSMLSNIGYHLNFFHSEKLALDHPEQMLGRLVTSNPQACWIILDSSRPAQRWFANKKIPAMVLGTCHSDIDLPDVDIDLAAVGRHSAGSMLSRGHRKAALLLSKAPGHFASEEACKEGFTQVFRDGGGEVIVAYHESKRDGVARVLDRLFKKPDPPTSLVVRNSLDYLSAISFLTQLGLHVPYDVSVVSRQDDAILEALFPEPARYRANHQQIVRKVFKLLTQVIEEGESFERNIRIIPEFILGESLADAKSSATDK